MTRVLTDLKNTGRIISSWLLACVSKTILNPRVSHRHPLTVHFFAVPGRLRHKSALLWRAKTKYSDFNFLFLNFHTVFRRNESDGISAIKFETAPIHFLSDLFVAVAWAPSGSLPGTWSKITSRSLRSLIGQLSFLLVPNMVLAKIKIHEHRAKETWELLVPTAYEFLVIVKKIVKKLRSATNVLQWGMKKRHIN